MQREAEHDDVCQLQLMAELLSAGNDTGIRVLIRAAAARRGVAAGNLPLSGPVSQRLRTRSPVVRPSGLASVLLRQLRPLHPVCVERFLFSLRTKHSTLNA